MTKDKSLKILFVASEVSPFAKTGGLADVIGSLPQALAVMGHDVRIAMPRYRVIAQPMETMADFPVPVGNRRETAVIRRAYTNSDSKNGDTPVPVYFVDNYQYFDREHLYCYFDEAERYSFFCRAVLEMLPRLDFKPDIIHCHDWQAGPVCALLKEHYNDSSFYNNIATLFTVHNLHYQGNYPKDALKLLDFDDDYYIPDRLEFYGDISFMKAGIVYSDIINTVSNTYAMEIQTPEYGERMDGLLRQRSKDLFGIVNGINYIEFDPKADPHISKNYDHRSVENKATNKYALQQVMKLPVKEVPLIGLISRLVDQKGLDLIVDICDGLMEKDIQLVILGTGDKRYENFFIEMAQQYPDKAAVYVGFNGPLAQQIYAGSDMFLMPSRFEPCGLGQLISLRYGTIPIVRATGGLADTVRDFDPFSCKGNGFVFKEYRADLLEDAVNRALEIYTKKKDLWKQLVKSALISDYSWTSSAKEYLRLYHLSIEKAHQQ